MRERGDRWREIAREGGTHGGKERGREGELMQIILHI